MNIPSRLVLYIKISAESVTVRAVRSDGSAAEVSDLPVVALHRYEQRIDAIGAAALEYEGAAHYEIVRLFNHPRVAMHRFEYSEKYLRILLRPILKQLRFPLLLRPLQRMVVVMHPVGTWLGGITDIEMRALVDLSYHTGRDDAIVIEEENSLTDAELLSLNGAKWQVWKQRMVDHAN
ncbi:MAG: hypothetical protein OHK0029_08540 [Armatimonadaceae bacterium]